MFDIEVWLREEGIRFKHVNDQNITWPCPFCGKEAGHFTVHLKKALYNCYRCNNSGYFDEIIAKIKNISLQEASEIFYSLKLWFQQENETDERTEIEPTGISLPTKSAWTLRTRSYLENRGWSKSDSDFFGCYPTSEWPYKGRIVFPVFENGRPVFFQARSTSNEIRPKYRSPKDSNKSNWLWNYDNVEGDTVVICEGIFSAFAIVKSGFIAVAVFGKTISEVQAKKLLGKGIRKIILMMDADTVFLKYKYRYHLDRVHNQLSKIFPEVKLAAVGDDDPGIMTEDEIKQSINNPYRSLQDMVIGNI